MAIQFDYKSVLEGLGQAVLIFDDKEKLIHENLAARTLLGKDLDLIKSEGWKAATTLFNASQTNPDEFIGAARDKALESERPIRFHIHHSGEHIPGWVGAIQSDKGKMHIMVTFEPPDWTILTSLLDRFRGEMKEAIDSTQGHVDLIEQNIKHYKDSSTADAMAKRISGFTRLIGIHMHRVGRFMEMLERTENIRTGRFKEQVEEKKRRIALADYFEDFAEEIDEIMLVDPETEAGDHRSRLEIDIPDRIAIKAPPAFLTQILHDIIRNAIMYSMKATPIKITAKVKNQQVQIDLNDEGYGIREKERDRVFTAFQRARQPQIIGEFGYGLSLYLCKHEVELMDGRMWYESEENVGTTFSIMLPIWEEETPSSHSSTD